MKKKEQTKSSVEEYLANYIYRKQEDERQKGRWRQKKRQKEGKEKKGRETASKNINAALIFRNKKKKKMKIEEIDKEN